VLSQLAVEHDFGQRALGQRATADKALGVSLEGGIHSRLAHGQSLCSALEKALPEYWNGKVVLLC
jgi:hypothetical protein